jgi:hypothetical protein
MYLWYFSLNVWLRKHELYTDVTKNGTCSQQCHGTCNDGWLWCDDVLMLTAKEVDISGLVDVTEQQIDVDPWIVRWNGPKSNLTKELCEIGTSMCSCLLSFLNFLSSHKKTFFNPFQLSYIQIKLTMTKNEQPADVIPQGQLPCYASGSKDVMDS